MRLGALTTEQLQDLPSSRSPIPTLPDGSPDYRFILPDLEMAWKWSPEIEASGPSTWLKANQGVVLTAAGALLLLAIMGGRRR